MKRNIIVVTNHNDHWLLNSLLNWIETYTDMDTATATVIALAIDTPLNEAITVINKYLNIAIFVLKANNKKIFKTYYN